MTAGPRFSIVILTYAREAILADTLDRLAGHLEGRSDYELLLVDNNVEAISRSAQLAPFNMAKLLWDGRNKGVAARNKGFEMARGDYVILLDDDVFVDTPDFLDRFAALFDADDRLGAITTRKYVRGETRRRLDLIPHTNKSVDLTRPFYTFRFVGGCVGFRAKTLHDVGGFLPDFFYGLEEVELAYRIIDGGWKIRYEPDIVSEELEHPAGRRPKRDVQTDRLANKYIISYLRMPQPWLMLNMVAFTPYLLYFAGGEASVSGAVRQFLTWLRKSDRPKRRPIGKEAARYIRACGGSTWR